MHLLLFTLASLFTVSAAPVDSETVQPSYPVVTQSAPFRLQLTSRNRTLNGSYLFAAHAGAAIESFVPTKNISLASQFNFNTTSYGSSSSNPSYNVTGEPGILTWTLVGGNFVEPEATQLVYDPASDVAALQIYPGNSTASQFAFDKGNVLNIPNYNAYRNKQSEALKRFYICQLYTTGYAYHSLGFKLGTGAPNDKSCTAVTVKRVFL